MDTTNVQADLKTTSPTDDTNSSFELESLDPETRQKVEEELKTELAKVSQQTNKACKLMPLSYPQYSSLFTAKNNRPKRRYKLFDRC